MPIWIGTKGLSRAHGTSFYAGTSEVKRVWAGTSEVWKRNDPLPTYVDLFSIPAGLPNEQQYSYSINTFSLGPNPLSTYDHLQIHLIASYYDPSAPPGQELVWFPFGAPDIVSTYGDTQLPAPYDYKYNLSTTGLLEITPTGSGPMGGWLHYPQMAYITGVKYN